MLKANDFYIDLGTVNTVIYGKNRGFLLSEPSLLAFKSPSSRKSELLAHGDKAKLMVGKTPLHSSVLKPLNEGVICDLDLTAKMLHSFFKKLKENISLIKPRILISLPCKVNHHERGAVEEVGYALGASKVHLLDEPMAAAIGAGVPVTSPQGHMIVDIGGGTTEVAILSLGGIVCANAVRIGGESIDHSIVQHLKEKYQFLIGEPSAERVKMTVGRAMAAKTGSSLAIGGLDLKEGLPRKKEVTSQMIAPAIEHFVSRLVLSVKKTFEECPPELAGDVAENGIILAGGGSLLNGLSDRLSLEVGVPVKACAQPLLSVARGGAKALEDAPLFDRLKTG